MLDVVYDVFMFRTNICKQRKGDNMYFYVYNLMDLNEQVVNV